MANLHRLGVPKIARRARIQCASTSALLPTEEKFRETDNQEGAVGNEREASEGPDLGLWAEGKAKTCASTSNVWDDVCVCAKQKGM